jgi:hypothetical protein
MGGRREKYLNVIQVRGFGSVVLAATAIWMWG